MNSIDTPIVEDEAEVKRGLAEAQAALETLRLLQAGQREPDLDPSVGLHQARAGLGQAQAALELVSRSLDQELVRRKQAERLQGEWEQRFRVITDAYPVAVGISTLDGTILYLNKVYTEIYGYSLDELMALNAADLYWDSQDRLKWFNELQEKGSVHNYEVQLKRKDGTPFWALLTAIQTIYTGVPAVIGTILDINRIQTPAGNPAGD